MIRGFLFAGAFLCAPALAQDNTTPDIDGRIGDWLVLGAFGQGGVCGQAFVDLVDPNTQPTLGSTEQNRTWQHYVPDRRSDGRFYTQSQTQGACNANRASVDFNAFFSNNLQSYGCPDGTQAFAYTKLCFDATTTAQIFSDADDGWRYWIDGQPIYSNQYNCRCYGDDLAAARRTHTFTAGCHDVLVQVGEGGGHWGFVWGLRHTNGLPMTTGVHTEIGGTTSDTPDNPCVCDLDRDGDGVCDSGDTCPGIFNPDQGECPTNCTDSDRDAVCDETDNCLGVPNTGQEDTDNDGIGDACETSFDADDDGIDDDFDNCPQDYNPEQADFDGDGLGDDCDDDADGDGDAGATDCDDLDPSRYNGAVEICTDGVDNDCDSLVDLDDTGGDCDGDGIENGVDNCPDQFNPGQADQDEDGEGDACDDDVDGDGVHNFADNCPAVANADQADFDGDGDGDACDGDADSDGVSDDVDMCLWSALSDTDVGVPRNGLGVNRWADLDGDGVFDTRSPKGRGPQLSFTMADTEGCSCADLITICGYGDGHEKFGCSISVMQAASDFEPGVCKLTDE